MLKWYVGNGYFWLRLFGYGFAIKDTAKNGMMFSERYNHTKHIMIGKYLIKRLNKL